MISKDIERMSETTTTPIGELYLQKQKEMDSRYRNVVIMMEIGKFYEVYTFETKDGEVGKAKEMSRVCNIVLTRKNKNVAPSMTNPYMCGFPSHSLPRYVQHLVANSFTVAVYTQNMTSDNKLERVLKGVYSPSVMIGEVEEEMVEDVDRCLLTLLVEKSTNMMDREEYYTVSHVCVNTTNGRVSCEEECFYHKEEAQSFVSKLYKLYTPQEVMSQSCLELEENHLPLPKDNKYRETGFQEIVLEKVYKKKTGISVIEEIGLERHPDLVAILTMTVSFLEEHHPLAVYRLQRPTFLQQTDHVSYNTYSLYDLNIFRHGRCANNKSLHEILDNTCTPAGKRLFRRTMFAPHTNISKLEKSYDEIEALMHWVDKVQFRREVAFSHIDMEHALRKIQTGNVGVLVVFRFFKMLSDFDDMIKKLPDHLEMVSRWKEKQNVMDRVWAYVDEEWDMVLMQSWRSWEHDGIWKQVPEVLHSKQMELDKKEKLFRKWVEQNIGKDMFQRLVFSEDEVYLNATKKIYTELKERPDLVIRHMSSSYRVSHARMDTYFRERWALLQFIIRTRKAVFQKQVKELVDQHDEIMSFMTDMTAHMDMMMSHATNAVRCRLQRPVPTTEKGVLSCQQLRHLIVEAMNPSQEYIANNVELTNDHGILLFGQNSAGKCFERHTQMVLWDGSHKFVEDLELGDVLIGDDGLPRKILALTRGNGFLYDVVRQDTKEVIMTVNEEHIMCLTNSKGDRMVEVPLKTILQKPLKYSGLMNQCTRNMSPDATREVVVDRKYFMNDEEWRKIYLSFLHCGRRIRYSAFQLIIEPSTNNIVPISIREKTKSGDYFGFGIGGNERFLMPDGNVCHNSTLMKSLGVAVLMAQCGMFVPCSSMNWTPFTSLFTKIGSRDDIWKGRSTFITEMNELKHMIDRSNDRTLVLCDELTSGTETYSATGIVASTLETFLEKKSKFIMTTHLHTLKKFHGLLGQLRVMHFGMEHHKEEQKLVFDRVLREGSGKSIYGLEIAEYLGFPDTFLKCAFQYRSDLDPASVPVEPKKRSRYNRKKWVDVCETCGSTQDLHTHHIQHQKEAGEDGYIGNYHKNRLSNLRILCRICHEKEHYHSQEDGLMG